MMLTGKRACLAAVLLIAALIVPAASFGAMDEIKMDGQAVSKKKAGVGVVTFPHARHKKTFKCAECHPKIFKDKLGANPINMKENMDGKFCGSPNCHTGQKTFALFMCEKCHVIVKGAVKK